jgi:hypothetical protein
VPIPLGDVLVLRLSQRGSRSTDLRNSAADLFDG